MNAVVKTPTPNTGLVAQFAARYAIDADKMLETLKQTAFKQKGKNGAAPAVVSNEQMMALLVVAKEYDLNPFTKEIYAFPSEGGIVPIISVDGWIRMINARPELDSLTLQYAPEGTESPWIECTIIRKDRSMPITVREYLDECTRDTGPWKSHPKRMLRHKAVIQCARLAFGFGGVYDPDEGARIVATIEQETPQLTHSKPATQAPKAKSKPNDAPNPDASKAPDTLPALISSAQVEALSAKIQAEGIKEEAVMMKYQIDSLAQLPANSFDSCIAWIDGLSGGTAAS